MQPRVIPSAAIELMALTNTEPAMSVNPWSPAGGRFRARVKKPAICPRLVMSSGQYLSLAGGLQPRVIPSRAIELMALTNTELAMSMKPWSPAGGSAQRSYEEGGHLPTGGVLGGAVIGVGRRVAALGDPDPLHPGDGQRKRAIRGNIDKARAHDFEGRPGDSTRFAMPDHVVLTYLVNSRNSCMSDYLATGVGLMPAEVDGAGEHAQIDELVGGASGQRDCHQLPRQRCVAPLSGDRPPRILVTRAEILGRDYRWCGGGWRRWWLGCCCRCWWFRRRRLAPVGVITLGGEACESVGPEVEALQQHLCDAFGCPLADTAATSTPLMRYLYTQAHLGRLRS